MLILYPFLMNGDNQTNKEITEGYRHIRKDVRRVLLTNTIILLLLIGLYFLNTKINIIEKLTGP